MDDGEKAIYLKQLEEALGPLMAELLLGEIQCIEYGDPKKPNGFYSAIRIRHIKTVGGAQFQVRDVSRRGESGSVYYPTVEMAKTYAMERVKRYLRPLPGLKTTSSPSYLQFFPGQESDGLGQR